VTPYSAPVTLALFHVDESEEYTILPDATAMIIRLLLNVKDATSVKGELANVDLDQVSPRS
jgi:hypothetical protein